MRSRLRSDAHGPKDRRPTAQTWGLAGLEGDSPPGERDPDEQESGVVEGNCTRTPGHSLSRVGVETEDRAEPRHTGITTQPAHGLKADGRLVSRQRPL